MDVTAKCPNAFGAITYFFYYKRPRICFEQFLIGPNNFIGIYCDDLRVESILQKRFRMVGKCKTRSRLSALFIVGGKVGISGPGKRNMPAAYS